MEYWYKATVTGVYDGDSITVDVDLGFHTYIKGMKLRLAGINAPELRAETYDDGLASRDWLRDKILNKCVKINTIKDTTEKYGRYLAYVYIGDENINNTMIVESLAKPY